MSQHDYVIDNASGATVRADINSALSAIQSLNSGTSAPSSTAAGMLWLDTTGGAPYVLKVRDAGNNHWLTLGNVTDPGADGNLELLPGKINLPSSGGIYESDGSTEILTESSGAVSLKNTTIDSTVTFPAGSVLQVKSTTKTDTFSQASSDADSPVTITGLTVDITPSSTSNKILVMYALDVSASDTSTFHSFLFRDTTGICIGDADGVRPRATMAGIGAVGGTFSRFNLATQFLDSPSTTSQITYSIKVGANGAVTAYINRSARDAANDTDDARGTSTITVMEIAG
jgi:hypothetical protein